ncbi:hypothetical protein VZQ01_22675 [Myxococcus faecalis]|uniref:hypothetical protein n=1 Tax=Myxococcus faecalis TaxID=3115646 RepID=UPI003CF5503A
MSALPPSLSPWAESLSLFPEPLSLHVGAYVARLAAAVGGMRSRSNMEGGEPEGYDGLSRRGSFDRLLVSEWLWALEAPEELVRRAAFGELSYLKPSFRQPQGARRTVVLLDAGPDQLGNPRIAHLALLIVMARRAEAAGAAFTWGVLQAPPPKQRPYSEVTWSLVLSWLGARDLAPPTEEQLAAWREALALEATPEDAWLVGDARLARLPSARGLSRVEVGEVMEPGERKLQVDVRPASREARSVVLDLPPADDCVRLLRDPFQARVAKPVVRLSEDRPTSFHFSAEGRRLVTFHADGSVSAMAIPASPTATLPKPRRIKVKPNQTVLAAGWRPNGGLLTLMEREDRYVLHGTLSQPRIHRGVGSAEIIGGWSSGYAPTFPSATPGPGRLFSWRDRGRHEMVLLLTRTGGLFLVYRVEAEQRIEMVALDYPVTAMVEVGNKLVYIRGGAKVPVSSRLERLRREPWQTGDAGKPVFVLAPQEDAPAPPPRTSLHVMGTWDAEDVVLNVKMGEACFGWASDVPVVQGMGLLAARHASNVWRMFLADHQVDITVPEGARVVGVGGCHVAEHQAGLFVLAADQRTLLWLTEKRETVLRKASDVVTHAEVSHSAPLLAWLTRSGELVVLDLLMGRVLYRATTGGR